MRPTDSARAIYDADGERGDLMGEHKSTPEPDVLERLEDWKTEYLKLASGSPTDNYISPMAARKVAEELADVIAEIKNTRNLLKLSLDALKLHQLEFEIRREGTEVRFENGTIHRVRTVSKFTNPDGGKRKIYFDRVAEPLEVGFDTMVEVME